MTTTIDKAKPVISGDDLRSDDAGIIALFRIWQSLTVKTRDARSDEEADAFDEQLWGSIEQIGDAPARSLRGLAIKTFVTLHTLCEEWAEPRRLADPCAIGRFDERAYAQRRIGMGDEWTKESIMYVPQQAVRGLLASLPQFAPELGPLVSEAVNSPLVLPPTGPAAFDGCGFSTRTKNALIAGGHDTPEKVLRLSKRQLSVIPNLGPVGRAQIEAYRERVRSGEPR